VWTGAPFRAHKTDAEGNAELILEKTWRPQLAVTAMDGYPLPPWRQCAVPYSTAKISLRCRPPGSGSRSTRRLEGSPGGHTALTMPM